MSPPIHRKPPRSISDLMPLKESPIPSPVLSKKTDTVAQGHFAPINSPAENLNSSPIKFKEIDILTNLITNLTIGDDKVAQYMKSLGITSPNHKLLKDNELESKLLSFRPSIHNELYPEAAMQRWADMHESLSSVNVVASNKIQDLTVLINDQTFTDVDVDLILQNMQIFKAIKNSLSVSADNLSIKEAFSKFRPLLLHRLHELEKPIDSEEKQPNYAQYFLRHTVDMQIKTLIAVIRDTNLTDDNVSKFIKECVNTDPYECIQAKKNPITWWFKIAKTNYGIRLHEELIKLRPLLASQLIPKLLHNK